MEQHPPAQPTEILEHVQYAPLPWQSHPIDLASGSQGWGPFDGPWSPHDFDAAINTQSGGSGINITWTSGDNTWMFGVPYATLSLFADASLGRVNNTQSPLVAWLQSQEGKGASTIAQADQASPYAPSAYPGGQKMTVLNHVRQLLGIGGN